MSDTYEIDDFDRVVPYSGGRRSHDIRTYRDATELELEQRAQIESLQSQVQSLEQERERLRLALTIYADRQNWDISVGGAIFMADKYEQRPWRFGETALQTTPTDSEEG